MFESLLALKPGTSDIAPSLATAWAQSNAGKTWTFTLRQGVKFQDGTDFNAQAACYNFDRWYNQKGIAQSAGVTQAWSNDWGGFAGQNKPSLFKSCEVTGDYSIAVNLTRYADLALMMTYNGYAMSSPTALKKYDADDVKAQGTGFTYPAYAMSHPTGTGPFTFVSYDQAAGTVTLERNDSYWGQKAIVSKVIFEVIPDENTRRQELEAGTIDAYDVPSPNDWDSLKAEGVQILPRQGANILYVGLNASQTPALKDLRVRQALLYAINRDQLVQTRMPQGSVVISNFIDPMSPGYNTALKPYPYDPQKAKELLAQAGYSHLTLPLWYPTEISRPYMPDPKAVFDQVMQDWQAVGITVQPVAKPWAGGFLDGRNAGQAPAYILGSIAHYNDSSVSWAFGVTDNAFDTGAYPFGQALADASRQADSESDPAKAKVLYDALEQKLMEDYLPSLPLASVPSAFAAGAKVHGLIPSPFGDEVYNTVYFS
jgi:peptide/nickel transport system substrate-binding protein